MLELVGTRWNWKYTLVDIESPNFFLFCVSMTQDYFNSLTVFPPEHFMCSEPVFAWPQSYSVSSNYTIKFVISFLSRIRPNKSTHVPDMNGAIGFNGTSVPFLHFYLCWVEVLIYESHSGFINCCFNFREGSSRIPFMWPRFKFISRLPLLLYLLLSLRLLIMNCHSNSSINYLSDHIISLFYCFTFDRFNVFL